MGSRAASGLVLSLILVVGCTPGHTWTNRRGDLVHEFFLQAGGRRVEVMAVWPKEGAPHPALVLVHGREGRAQRFRRPMFKLARRGFAALALSLPGFGDTPGPDDYAGPAQVEAVLAAIRYLEKDTRVQPGQIALYGISRGATVALLAARQSPSVRALALEAGAYDLARAYETTVPEEREKMERLIGGSPASHPERYAIRSPLADLRRLEAAVLLLHGTKTKTYRAEQSVALASALRDAGVPVWIKLYDREDKEHFPGSKSLTRHVLPFLRVVLGGESHSKR
ncbi:MAG: alpha/beta hydrolase family protein [Nitrospinota bacterium]